MLGHCVLCLPDIPTWILLEKCTKLMLHTQSLADIVISF